MEISLQLEKSDWQRFQKHTEKRLTKTKARAWHDHFFIRLFFWSVIGFLAMWFYRQIGAFQLHLPSVLFSSIFFILFLSMFIFSLIKIKKAAAPSEQGMFIGQHTFFFGEDKITSTSKHYSSSLDWAAIIKVERANGLIILYLDTLYGLLFPEEKLDNPELFYAHVMTNHLKAHHENMG